MIEKQNATHSNELTKLGASELGAAQLEAVTGGFCGFFLPVTSQGQSKTSTSDIVIKKTTDTNS
jgi:hypothetical protein